MNIDQIKEQRHNTSPKKHPPLMLLRSLLDYDPESGIVSWRCSTRRAVLGSRAGTLQREGYLVIGIGKRRFMAHRIAWHLYYGSEPELQIDHINRNRSDNRLANLRSASHAENCQNHGLSVKNKSGVIGVCWSKPHNKWHSTIKYFGKHKCLGYFRDKQDAINARIQASSMLHDQFSPHHN